MGLTNLGYRRRTLEEILQAKIDKAKELFGENINTEENTALGKYIRINAYDQYNVEELAEQIYYSIFPQTASGQSLDRLGWSVGMTRNVATPAQYKVRVRGVFGETVPYGFLVGTETGLNFYNTADTAFEPEGNADGICTITVECVEAGTIGNVSAGDINKIINPVAYIDEVQGIEVHRAGTDMESDYDFRQRYEIVREGRGGCTVASIVAALTNIDTVQGAFVLVNESATETVNEVPPKTIACYIKGGNDKHQEIAEAIFAKKPIGIGTHGNETVAMSYGGLSNYEIKFSHSGEVGVYVNIEPFITNNEYQTSGNSDIKANIENFIANLDIGGSVVTTALYSQIYSVAGVVSAIVTISKDGASYSADNIEVLPYEHCVLAELRINGVPVE